MPTLSSSRSMRPPPAVSLKILKYVAVHDAGRILNPMLAEGQVHGALAQGLGQALMEGMEFTDDGQPLTPEKIWRAINR